MAAKTPGEASPGEVNAMLRAPPCSPIFIIYIFCLQVKLPRTRYSPRSPHALAEQVLPHFPRAEQDPSGLERAEKMGRRRGAPVAIPGSGASPELGTRGWGHDFSPKRTGH